MLGGGAAVIHQWWTLAWIAWIAGVAFWLALLYPPLLGVIIGDPKPKLGEGINGTWFLLTVSTESVAVLGALLLGHRNEPSQLLELTVLAAFTLGLVLSLIVMTLIFLRWTFYPLGPDELQPPSWIAAGAVAITVLAWATATFWFPVMIAIGIWRHLVKRVPLRYHPAYWALVFPIGMYGVATYRMIAVTGLHDLDLLPQLALAMALTAWTAAFVGLVVTLIRGASPVRRAT